MNVEEGKKCLNFGKRIFYDNKEFLRIRSLIFIRDKGKFSIFAELLDKNNNSIYRVPLDLVEIENTKENYLKDYPILEEKNKILKENFFNFLNTFEDFHLSKTKNNIEKLIKNLQDLKKEIDLI